MSPCSRCHGPRERANKYYCRACDNEYQREWRARNPEAHRRIVRRANLKQRFGLTEEEFSRLAIDGCGICGTHDDLCVDHDHETGVVRGVLCRKCNAGIGLLGDDPALLARAARYLTDNDRVSL